MAKAKKATPKKGRPSEYKERYIKAVDDYLGECRDFTDEVSGRFIVNLPTVEDFALYLGVAKSSLYLWKDQHKAFSDALERIVNEQHRKVVNNGLAGNYNSTIAKLILSSNHNMRERGDVTSDDKPIQSNTITFKDMSDAAGSE